MRHFLAVSILLAIALSINAQDRIPEKILHAPSRLPDRIVLTWRKEPTRTQAVTWRTDTSVTTAVAECAEAKTGPDFEKKTSVAAVTSLFKSDLGEAHFHTAHFENLTPDAKYAYRVGDGVNWSEWNHFKTASEQPDKFSFLYFGDAQYQLKEHWSRVVREAYRAAPDARFSIHAGDLVNVGGRDAEWGEWFQAAEWINRTMPVIPTPGNHEYIHDEGRKLPRYWSKQFALPDHGPKDLGIFHLDFQGVRIISLNTNEKMSAQVDWLKDVLRNNPNRWTILTFHHPVYSASATRDDPAMRKLLQPIFDKYRVDLVLQGHDHCYGRSALLSYDGAPGGTVYVISVSGPGFNASSNEKWMARKGENVQLFQVITIDGDYLHFEARTATGELFDSFTLSRQEGKTNVLKNGTHHPRSVLPINPITESTEAWKWGPLAVVLLLAGVLLAFRLLRRRRAD